MAEKTFIQTVPPQKATKETLWLILIVVVMTIVSVIIIKFNQRDTSNFAQLKSYEINYRYDLKNQEQGIVQDLMLAFRELKYAAEEGNPSPDVDYWVEENFPPFTDRLEEKERGNHKWTKVKLGDRYGYLGFSQDVDTARHFLWLLPHHPENATLKDFEVWMHGGTAAPPKPESDTVDALVKSGWMLLNRDNEIQERDNPPAK